MAFGTQDESDEVMNEINMTPLVDVMLVLLIIFIITVPVMKHSVNVDLPRATNQPENLKQRLLKLSADSEAQLAKADNLAVVSLSDRLDYLIGGLNLERVEVDHKGDETWTPESLQALTQTLKDNEVALVLDHRQPAAAVKAAIAEGGSELVVIGAEGADPVAELQGNIDAIVKVLNKSQG